jgi:excisionase family DNA binding protein
VVLILKTLYKVSEVANITGFAEGTIRNKISAGEIDTIKVGGGTRITKEALEKFIGIKVGD